MRKRRSSQPPDAAPDVDPEPGVNFAPQKHLAGVGTSHGPALATFDNHLYMAWKGMGNDQAIYWSSFDGTTGQRSSTWPGWAPAMARRWRRSVTSCIWPGKVPATTRVSTGAASTGPTGAPRARSPESVPASGPHWRYSATTCTWPGKASATTRASTGPCQPEA